MVEEAQGGQGDQIGSGSHIVLELGEDMMNTGEMFRGDNVYDPGARERVQLKTP